MHIDEAMLFANALSIEKNGTDLLGDKLPVYFPTWLIGGQSPFATYLSALSVKIFGNCLFTLRLPVLIIGCIGFVCSSKLSDLLFTQKEYKYAFVGLMATSPWMIFSSCYVLDCNYLSYNLIFGLLLFLNGQKQSKNIYYIFSMLFFSLCFYSYIASVLIVPIFLAILYLILFLKKRIKISNCVVSVISLTIFSIPFIIFGLVLVGKIKPFTTQIISFPDMKFYSRDTDIALNSGNILTVFKTLLKNLYESISILLFIDNTALSNNSNLFQYGNFGAGLISLYGLINIILTKIHKKKVSNNVITNSVIIASLCSIIVFCAMTNSPSIFYAYRYGVLTPLLLLFEATGLALFIKKLKNIDIKKFKMILAGYLIISLTIFSFEFFFIYSNDTKYSDLTYGDSLKICLDESENISPEDTTIICNARSNQRSFVYLCYYRQDKTLNNFLDCMLDIYSKSDKLESGYYMNKTLRDKINAYAISHTDCTTSNKINVSDTIVIFNSYEIELTEKCYIVQHSELYRYDYDNYNIKENGFYDLLIRKQENVTWHK